MKTIVDEKNVRVQEIEEDDFLAWLKDNTKETHPIIIAKTLFNKKVMDAITSDHHKSKDGVLTICYDYFAGKWYITHPGYIRDIEVEAGTYLSAAENFMSKVHISNAMILNSEVIDEVNKLLPKDYYVECSDHSISLYHCEKGEERVRQISLADIAGMSAQQVYSRFKNAFEE